jgi:1-acyl-sn-glycerol-3-phosphate acyltransferase
MGLLLRNLFISFPGILGVTIVTGTASLIASLFAKTGRTQHRCSRLWARGLLAVSGVKLQVEGRDRIPPGGTFVFVANHRTYLDAAIMLASIDTQFRFFAKASVFWWPIIGFHLRRSGHMPVHYTNPQKSLKSMSAAARVIQQRNVSVLVFPEAERTEGDLQPFKDGAAYVAIKAGVPVMPVGLVGNREVMPVGAALIRPGTVRIQIGQAIPTLDLTLRDRTRLTQTMWVRIAELIGWPVPEDLRQTAGI